MIAAELAVPARRRPRPRVGRRRSGPRSSAVVAGARRRRSLDRAPRHSCAHDGVIAGARRHGVGQQGQARRDGLDHGAAVGAGAAAELDAYSLPAGGRPASLVRRSARSRFARSSPRSSLPASRPSAALRVNPYDLDRLGVADGHQVKVTSTRTTVTVAAPSPTRPCPRRRRRSAFNQPGLPRRRSHRRHRGRHRRPGGDAVTLTCSPLDPLLTGDVGLAVVAHRRSSRSSIAFVVPAGRRDADGLVRAQGHRRHAEPHRAEPGRAVGHPADARRRHQALLQGGPASPSAPTGSCSGWRRTCRSCPRSSRSPIVPIGGDFTERPRRHRHASSATTPTCSWPTRRSASCSCWRCRRSRCTA